jgi:hypothetical protein
MSPKVKREKLVLLKDRSIIRFVLLIFFSAVFPVATGALEQQELPKKNDDDSRKFDGSRYNNAFVVGFRWTVEI